MKITSEEVRGWGPELGDVIGVISLEKAQVKSDNVESFAVAVWHPSKLLSRVVQEQKSMLFLCLGAILNIPKVISTQTREKQDPLFQLVPFIVSSLCCSADLPYICSVL